MKSKSIEVPFESFLFLQEECFRQRNERGMTHFSENHIARLRKGYESCKPVKYLMSGSLGGCNGSPIHAWEEGRWTSWTVDDMKRMLDENGLPWKDGPEIEHFYA